MLSYMRVAKTDADIVANRSNGVGFGVESNFQFKKNTNAHIYTHTVKDINVQCGG